MSVDEENQKYAGLCSELRATAEAKLMAPLKKAGATPEAASEACVQIAASVAVWLILEEGAHYPFDEIGQVRKTLAELEGNLNRLSLAAALIMQDYIWDEEEKTSELFSAVWLEIKLKHDTKHDTWQTFQRFRDALPQIVESLPTKPPKKKGHDARRQDALESAIWAWQRATGHFPPATVTAAGLSSSPLLAFFHRRLGTDGLSPGTFARTIRSLKQDSRRKRP